MEVKALSNLKQAPVIVIPYFEGDKEAEPAFNLKKGGVELGKDSLAFEDFKGKNSETLPLYVKGRYLLLGLGKKADCKEEELRRAYGAAARTCLCKKWSEAAFFLPEGLKSEVAFSAAEGIYSASYLFTKYKKENGQTPLKKLFLANGGASELSEFKRAGLIAEGAHLARDLVNTNADEATPEFLAMAARKIAKRSSNIKVKVFDKKLLEKEGLSMLLTVGRGAANDPRLIILEYRGNPKDKEKTVLVGKGITFDTGGLNLKPTGSIESMKNDMGGAAAVLGTLLAVANLKLKVNVAAVVASAENAIDAASYKPGDIYPTRSGKTVEIGNTDAEGRLVLADALSYTVDKLKPSEIIDFATLTGAMVIALGDEMSGMMSNNDKLAEKLVKAGERSFERVWRLPLVPEYRERLKSDIADLKNIGGRAGGSIIAGHFLQEFVKDVPWAHIDIAGTAHIAKAQRYVPKLATGVGVRLIIDYLTHK